MMTAERARELAEVFDARSKAPTSMDCPGHVVTNLLPTTLADIAAVLRDYANRK